MAAGHVIAWGHVSLQVEQGLFCPLAGWGGLRVGWQIVSSVKMSDSFRVISDSLFQVCPFLCTQVFVAFTHLSLNSRNETVLPTLRHQAARASLEISSL